MKLTKPQRSALCALFEGHCAYCGCVLPEKGWHADHVEPIYRKTKYIQGTADNGYRGRYVQTGECFAPERNHIGNFMPACRACNIDKGADMLEDWRRGLERKPQVLRDNYSAFRHAERFGLVAQVETKVTFYFERVAGDPVARSIKEK